LSCQKGDFLERFKKKKRGSISKLSLDVKKGTDAHFQWRKSGKGRLKPKQKATPGGGAVGVNTSYTWLTKKDVSFFRRRTKRGLIALSESICAIRCAQEKELGGRGCVVFEEDLGGKGYMPEGGKNERGKGLKVEEPCVMRRLSIKYSTTKKRPRHPAPRGPKNLDRRTAKKSGKWEPTPRAKNSVQILRLQG